MIFELSDHLQKMYKELLLLHTFALTLPSLHIHSISKTLYLISLTSKHPIQPKDQPAPAPAVASAAAAVAADHTPAVGHTADAAADQEAEAAAHSHAATYSAVAVHIAVVVHIADSGLAGEKSIGFEVRRRVERWACRRKLGCRNSFVVVVGNAVDAAVGRIAVEVAGVERSFVVVDAACRVMVWVACHSLESLVVRQQGCSCCMSAVVAVA